MLDHCSISHKGGIVLWSRSFTPAAEQLASSSGSPVNSFIREVLIEGRTAESNYEKDGYAIKWSFVNDLELIFVVAYQRILQLTYPEELLSALKTLFLKLFQPFLTTFVASLHAVNDSAATFTSTVLDFRQAFEGWDKIFDKLLAGFEERAGKDRNSRLRPTQRLTVPELQRESSSESVGTLPTKSEESAPNTSQEIARNVVAMKSRLRSRQGPTGGKGRNVKKTGKGGESAPGSDSDNATTARRRPEKVARKWDDSAITENDMAALDFSTNDSSPATSLDVNPDVLIDKASLGTKKNGIYEVKDWNFLPNSEDKDKDDMISRALNSTSLANGTDLQEEKPISTLGSILARLTGSKVLTAQDLKPVLNAMKEHLMKKNVAKEISEKICEGIGESLKGKKIGGFRGIRAEVRSALSITLTRILTPKTSTDLLLSIRAKITSAAASTSSAGRVPYSITFVGVNGVGKSTNLSKVCFWLIQNGLRVLVAACDTFRSGAVEQLRVHVRNLGMLSVREGSDERTVVELYERGYGKDAAGIAKDAISYAKDKGFDVVLIDTAGRMQDNEPLMRALAKLVSANNPDKIIFVGEALVGNEAVDQLTKFDRSLRDFSTVAGGPGKGRGIDGMLVTKWDSVDDKVGAALSMTYVTGQPIIFVGCGQTYTDLRQLQVSSVVEALLSD